MLKKIIRFIFVILVLLQSISLYAKGDCINTLPSSLINSIGVNWNTVNSGIIAHVNLFCELEDSDIQDDNSFSEFICLSKIENCNLLFILTFIVLVLLVAVIVLLTSKLRLVKNLRQSNDELIQLNSTKDKFFSIIAHDLKSPFNTLMGFSEMLSLHSESKSKEDIIKASGLIFNSTRKLYLLVDNLLQWSRTQLGTTRYSPEMLDISIISSNIVSILRINAEEKDIVISLDIAAGTVAWGDKDLFSGVLRNLISNAIKFSRVGSIILIRAVEKNNLLELSVKDSGVGMTKQIADNIFNIDNNTSTEGTFNETGTGLGLVLCKEFVFLNKGNIWVESELEKGTIFTFTLPLTKI